MQQASKSRFGSLLVGRVRIHKKSTIFVGLVWVLFRLLASDLLTLFDRGKELLGLFQISEQESK